MATDSKIILARDIADIKKQMEDAAVRYKALTDQLIKLVGNEGQTFVTSLGDVQVTQQTADRFGDNLVISFDKDVYMALDQRTKNRLQSQGIVKVDRQTIKGMAPKVVVRLK